MLLYKGLVRTLIFISMEKLMRNNFFNKNNIKAEQFGKELNKSNPGHNIFPAFSELEKSFLNLFFKQHRSFYEIADILNITKMQVRQLKQMALIKIRNK